MLTLPKLIRLRTHHSLLTPVYISVRVPDAFLTRRSVAVKVEMGFEGQNFNVDLSHIVHSLVIVGGRTPPIAELSREIEVALAPLVEKVLPYASLEVLDERPLDGDLQKNYLGEMYKFRRVLETKREILWLTSGRLEHRPYCNMTIGFDQSAMHEDETLRVQYVDVTDVDKLDPEKVAEYIVRFTSTRLDLKDILYTKESEVIIDPQGQELVPRLSTITDVNSRLNSTIRPIFERVDISKIVVSLEYGKDGPNFRQMSPYELAVTTFTKKDKLTELHLTHFTVLAIRCPTGCYHLSLGYDKTRAQRLSLTAGVALFTKLEAFPPISYTNTDKTPPTDGTHSFMYGKWTCGNVLKRAYEKYGLRIDIQRPSTIIDGGKDATVERTVSDWIDSLLHLRTRHRRYLK
ncbi:hypothetical protein C7974DRAFT_444372 [Boeremia exigua]|uniref:uncharacterized protein n=1 Tax=Boeremia exigua TaxID=749465 RepID=UPI001E8D64B4|nr:uncharacterized protein C7974DRAFT_444372 [Boeremia exigua]KAH6612963.1 hypothetical protein C7974DRAFT_444372 [Boeremia exigua]